MSGIKKFKLAQISEWLICLPVLFIFLINIIFLGKNIPVSDGIRYWQTASDILNGFKDNSILESYLFLNGPLYPLILSFFKGIGFSVKASIFLNAFFLYIGFTYFYKTASFLIGKNRGIWITYILVFIDPFLFYWSAKLYSESLAILWVCLLIYFLNNYFITLSLKTLFKVSIIFCLLALTRVIFAYVLLVLIPLGYSGYLIFKKQIFKSLGRLGILGLLFCLPYLIFTYSISNKIFFLSGNGGQLLYWTSSPFESDLGEWHTIQIEHDHFASRYTSFSGLDSLYLRNVNDVIISEINKNHFEFAQSLSETKNLIEYDDKFKAKAFENIKNHPTSFLKNWFLNSGRLLVGIPHAMYHKPPFSPFFTLINTVKSSFLLCFFVVATLLFIKNFTLKNYLLTSMLILLLIYLVGQSILAVQSQRFLLPIYPLIIMFTALSFSNYIQFKKPKS